MNSNNEGLDQAAGSAHHLGAGEGESFQMGRDIFTADRPVFEGTKRVRPFPMTRGQWCAFRGWEVPADENPKTEGYLVEYLDGGKPNHPDFEGYISWSPADVFERSYKPVSEIDLDAADFSDALMWLREGRRVARADWNGKSMWLRLVKPPQSATPPDMRYDVTVGDEYTFIPGVKLLPWIGMKTADGCFVPWLASQTDMLANDWQVVTA